MSGILPATLRGRDLISLADFSSDEINALLSVAAEMKREQRSFRIDGKTLVMLFFNYSLRTRASFEIACQQLGVNVVTLNNAVEGWDLEWRDGVKMDGKPVEHVKDMARVLSRYADAIGVRSYPPMINLQEDRADPLMSKFCANASVPVINLESATAHPCQGLSDLMTLRELFPHGLGGKKIVLSWIPHVAPVTQSVANSFLHAAALSGANITIARPEGFELEAAHIASVKKICSATGATLKETDQQAEALDGADVVYAKSWVSSKWYGDWAAESKARVGLDDKWRLTADSMALTHRAKFMHPLPIRRNVSVDDAVLDSGDCVVYQQAENRLHLQKALLLGLLG